MSLLSWLGLGSAIVALAACQAAPPSVAKPAGTALPTEIVRKGDVIPTPVTAGKIEAPVAPPTRGEPKGKIVYDWHVAISPTYLDPQENQAVITPYGFQYAIHDALVKHMPGQPYAPSLAESYEIAPDFRSATFTLREGIQFHNGEPVTPDDVKFTFENYRGAQAKTLKDKVSAIEILDSRTLRFVFKEPFPDFLVLYGSPASGAGWVVPRTYYESVGPDGFKKAPIGAGPYKVVRFQLGVELELEAFTGYWRKTPAVKTLIMREVPEDSTRLARLKKGESDLMSFVFGSILDDVRKDRTLQVGANLGSPFYLEFPELQKPGDPFGDKRVRQAVSYALDRQALSDQESGGLAAPTGNWIPETWPGAVAVPADPFDLPKAKQLLAEAGYPNGFDIPGGLTPIPPYNSFAERVIGQLRAVGIRAKLNTMERAVFLKKLTEGQDAFEGIILQASGTPGDAAGRLRAFAQCPPKGSSSRLCLPDIDQKMARYDASVDSKERLRLLTEIQWFLIDEMYFVPIYRSAFTIAIGPRIAGDWREIINAIPQYVYVGPYEDVRLKE